MSNSTTKLQFSGHESFHCRQYWLKKGFDFIEAHGSFNDDNAVVKLGVGKNMVTAIQYWLKAFDLLSDKNNPNDLAKRIFGNNGWDPFLEDDGTLWLLHFKLAKRNSASIFNMIFNDLRKGKPEFEDRHFQSLALSRGKFSSTTLSKDFTVFRNTYCISSSSKSEVEDSYSGIFTELNLVTTSGGTKNEALIIESKRRPEISTHVILYCILTNDPNRKSLDFERLYSQKDSIGSLFALSREGLVEKLEELVQLYPKEIVFKSNSGVREIQFKKPLSPIRVLSKYYER